MVKKISPKCLIATTRTDVTPSLNELRDGCGWPLLLGANPRRLAQELSIHSPECVLFWLEDQHGIAPTARLVEWSRERGARPYRVAVAFGMDADVEAVFRAAGTHGFLPIAHQAATAVADALWPLLHESTFSAGMANETADVWTALEVPVTALELPADLMRPP